MGLILLPVGIGWLYREITKFPEEITIGTGPPGGRYRVIAKALEEEIITRHPDVDVTLVPTNGSLENLLLLREGKLDLALYQPGIYEAFKEHDLKALESAKTDAKKSPLPRLGDPGKTAFVANLYSQPAHLIIRQDAKIDAENLQKMLKHKKVALGTKQSGAFGMSMILLKHFGLKKDDLAVKYADSDAADYYDDVKTGFKEGDLDAAFITMGVRAPIFNDLARTGKCAIVSIPNRKALLQNNLYLSQYTIPAGLYGDHPYIIPRTEVETVASGAQLLTREKANAYLVEAVTRIVLDKNFARQNHLNELFEYEGRAFALKKAETAIHDGAQSVYDPEFDIHLVETGEAAYSLAVSTAIAAFFGVRWLRKRGARKKEHKLDRYIRSLLVIEEQQVGLDQGAAAKDLERLQKLLDEVTFLRQTALRELSAHELNEDRGADCFIEMCHALSNKINAKISRQRLDTVMHCLIEATKGGAASGKEHSATATDVEESASRDRPDR